MIKSIRENRRITLIALVITIVILIILAAVAINLTIGENGILSRAKDAKKRYNEAEACETMNLKLTEAKMSALESTIEGNILYKIAIELENVDRVESVESTARIASIDSSLANSLEKIYVILTDYSFEFVISGNGEIENYYKIGDTSNVVGDTNAPTVEITSMTNSADYLFTISAQVTITDDESEVDYSKCKYVFTTSNTPIGTNPANYTDGSIDNTGVIEKVKGAQTYYLHVLATDSEGNSSETVSSNTVTVASVANFDYTTNPSTGEGTEQTASLPAGTYKFECWGAQGGNIGTESFGGKGGYSSGVYVLNQNKTLNVVVGGQGFNDVGGSGGYNGGGIRLASYSGASGGGATHIAEATGLLPDLVNNKQSIIIVAGRRWRSWRKCK